MPAEKFYQPDSAPGSDPNLAVAWGDGTASVQSADEVLLNWDAQDVSGLNRLIRSLKRARDHLLQVEAARREEANVRRRLSVLFDALEKQTRVVWICPSATRMRSLFEALADTAADEFGKDYPIRRSHGSERIGTVEFHSTSRRHSLRGLSADLIVLDEVEEVPQEALPIINAAAEVVRIESARGRRIADPELEARGFEAFRTDTGYRFFRINS